MNRYNIRLGDEILDGSFTYDELQQKGVFDPENKMLGIAVRKLGETTWTSVDLYPFPERTAPPTTPPPFRGTSGNASTNNSKKNKPQYTINEFGEVVSETNIGGGGGQKEIKPQKSNDTGFKVFMTIVVVIIFIIISATTGWGSIPAGAVGAVAINSIWKK